MAPTKDKILSWITPLPHNPGQGGGAMTGLERLADLIWGPWLLGLF